MVDNNNNKGALLVLLFAKRNQQTIKLIIFLGVEKYIPTSRISLASTLCTQGLFTPVAGNA